MTSRPDASREPVEMETGAALAHLYRGEMQRSTAWLARLDRTTNWAVITTTALLTWTLGDADNPHGVLLLGMGSLLFFLWVEARRYRTYDVWRSRLRLLEQNLYAPVLAGTDPPEPGWRTRLSGELAEPRFTMPLGEALGRRLRRTYGWLFAVLLLGWLGKLLVGSEGLRPLDRVLERAEIRFVPGWAVLCAVFILYVGLLVLALSTRGSRRATGRIGAPDFQEV